MLLQIMVVIENISELIFNLATSNDIWFAANRNGRRYTRSVNNSKCDDHWLNICERYEVSLDTQIHCQ